MREAAAFADSATVADVGCSNGYVTNLLSAVCRGKTFGFDHSEERLAQARADYPHIEFERLDLNTPADWRRTFDLVCCFETLEHVGNLEQAVGNVVRAVRTGGTLILSMPVEVGPWGIAKYCAKTALGYPMDELGAGRLDYLLALLRGGDVKRFRDSRPVWGTHYGFDWREVERAVAATMELTKSYTLWANRIVVARKP